MKSFRPLLQGLTTEEILEAAERWLGLLSAQHLTWTCHAGYQGDEYPVQHPDERFLSIGMWTLYHENGVRVDQHSAQTRKETIDYLTQFADTLREMAVNQAKADVESVTATIPIKEVALPVDQLST